MTEMLEALLGGALVGFAATLYWYANGRVAGVSGVLRSAVLDRGGPRTSSGLFLTGLVVAGLATSWLGRATTPVASGPVLVVAGLLVGFGARMGGGCTSGHGVCGLSRFSLRSLVAVLTFMTTAALTVFFVAHVLPGARHR